MAIKTGAPLAPYWIAIMDASKEWGVPPWTWAGGVPLIWFIRYSVLSRERNRAVEDKGR